MTTNHTKEEGYSHLSHTHCFDQQNPPCGLQGKHCCLCDICNEGESWEEKFDSVFDEYYFDEDLQNEGFFAPREKIKSFIRSLLAQKDQEWREKIIQYFMGAGELWFDYTCSPKEQRKSVEFNLGDLLGN